MPNNAVNKRELATQQESLAAGLKAVESTLSDEQHAQVTRLLIELSAYNIMRLVHELQAERLQHFR